MNARCVRCIQSEAFLSGRPPHSASEQVERVPNVVKKHKLTPVNSRTKCVLALARGTCKLGSLLLFSSLHNRLRSSKPRARFLEFPTLVYALVINRDNVKWCAVVQRARYPTYTTIEMVACWRERGCQGFCGWMRGR